MGYKDRTRSLPEIRVSQRKSRQLRRDFIDKIKTVPCMDCLQIFSPECMDFDHRDPETKLFTISNHLARSMDVILEEIAKCDIVCANCHRTRTKKERLKRAA